MLINDTHKILDQLHLRNTMSRTVCRIYVYNNYVYKKIINIPVYVFLSSLKKTNCSPG